MMVDVKCSLQVCWLQMYIIRTEMLYNVQLYIESPGILKQLWLNLQLTSS